MRKWLRAISYLVLVTFTSFTLQPLTAAAQLPSPAKREAPVRSDSGEERYSRLLKEIHEILKEVVPQAAMPHRKGPASPAAGKPGEKVLQAVGPKIRLESELPKPLPVVDVAAKVKSLRSKYKELKSLEVEVDKGFKATEKQIRDQKLPAEILARQEAAVAEYEKRKAEFDTLMQAVDSADDGKGNLQAALTGLGDFMAKYPNEKTHTPTDPNNLPWGSPKPVTRAPYTSPSQFKTSRLFGEPVKVAQAGSLSGISLPNTTLPTTPNAGDLAATDDVQITQPIRDLATSLNNNPTKIYNWVRNNIDYLPTYGSIQGSDMTLQAKRGNAFDNASLLIALLRAAGVPARYVYGTVEVPANKVMNWVGGMTVPQAAINLMGKGGIPVIGVVQGGQLASIRFEHVWVEAYVDYTPSRGAVNRNPNTWVPMDASFKQYAATPSLLPADLTSSAQNLATAYTQSVTSSPDGAWSTGFDATLVNGPIASLQTKMADLVNANTDKVTLEDFIGGRSIIASEPAILLGTLPYRLVATGAEMAALPSNLRVTARVEVYTVDPLGAEGNLLLSQLVALPSLGYASLSLTHPAATPKDDAVLGSYISAGATSFPPYLVNVKSRLLLDGVLLGESSPIGTGQDLELKVSFEGAGQAQSVSFNIVAGDEIQIGMDGAGYSPSQGFALQNRTDLGTAAGNLYVTAKAFWTQQDAHEKLFASLQGVAAVRLPSAGIFAVPLSVIYNFGIPSKASYHSRQVDIKLSRAAAEALDGNARTTTTFAIQAGVIASSTEGAVIEQVFSKPLGHGSNTVRLLELANRQRIPIYHLTQTNIAANRAALQHAPEVMADIDNALGAGLEVIIPQVRQTNGTWTGSGYIMMDPATGSADYRVSGGLSGNFDDAECQRQVEPIKVVIPDASIIWLILLGWMVDDDFNFNGAGTAALVLMVVAVVVLLAIVVAPVVTAGVAAGALLSRAAIAAVLLAVSGLAEAADGTDPCSCKWTDIGRRGGNSIFTQVHNMCADRFTDIPGRDIELREVAFDGIRQAEFPPNGTLYEIKTGLFYSTIKGLTATRPKLQGFLDALMLKAIGGYWRERIPSYFCGYEFRYGSRDPALVADMQATFAAGAIPSEAARVFNSACPP